MNCKRCGRDLKGEDIVGYEILEAHGNDLCWNCWYESTYSYANEGPHTKYIDKTIGNNTSNIITTLEYILVCIDCKHQTPYSYLWFAIQDGRNHVLTSGHKFVTISQIVWEEDKALEII